MADYLKSTILEVLSGPLDGTRIELEGETLWTGLTGSRLSFPWDGELGQPQARLFVRDGCWMLEAFPSQHGTYCMAGGEGMRLGEVEIELQRDMLIKASSTWLKVISI
jgi:hypothetical protein